VGEADGYYQTDVNKFVDMHDVWGGTLVRAGLVTGLDFRSNPAHCTRIHLR